jgi:hypothetical protein
MTAIIHSLMTLIKINWNLKFQIFYQIFLNFGSDDWVTIKI